MLTRLLPRFKHLTFLALADHSFSFFPLFLDHSSLQTVELNNITAPPSCWDSLRLPEGLTTLILDNCGLGQLPAVVNKLKNLERVVVKNNPNLVIKNLPSSVRVLVFLMDQPGTYGVTADLALREGLEIKGHYTIYQPRPVQQLAAGARIRKRVPASNSSAAAASLPPTAQPAELTATHSAGSSEIKNVYIQSDIILPTATHLMILANVCTQPLFSPGFVWEGPRYLLTREGVRSLRISKEVFGVGMGLEEGAANAMRLQAWGNLNMLLRAVPRLKRLILEGCELTFLPPALSALKELEELDISNNPLGADQLSFALPALRVLYAGGCGLHFLPLPLLQNHANLEALYVPNNPALLLPAMLQTTLKRLYVQGDCPILAYSRALLAGKEVIGTLEFLEDGETIPVQSLV